VIILEKILSITKRVQKTIKTIVKFRDHRFRRSLLYTFVVQKILKIPIVFPDRNGFHFIVLPEERIDLLFLNGYMGISEISEQEYSKKVCAPGMIVFDIGANIGQFALLFASLVSPSGRVFAFEPCTETMRRLKANIELNNFKNIITEQVIVYSLPGKTMKLNIFPPGRSVLNTLGEPAMRVRGRPGVRLEPVQQESVGTVTIDSYCIEHGIASIDYLKIDVEGAELDVLQGCICMLRDKAIRMIQFEISQEMLKGMRRESHEIFTFLNSLGYQCHPISADAELLPHVQDTNSYFANFIAMPIVKV